MKAIKPRDSKQPELLLQMQGTKRTANMQASRKRMVWSLNRSCNTVADLKPDWPHKSYTMAIGCSAYKAGKGTCMKRVYSSVGSIPTYITPSQSHFALAKALHRMIKTFESSNRTTTLDLQPCHQVGRNWSRGERMLWQSGS
jgi:hypothetical protein